MSELEELYDSKLALYMAMRLGRLAIVFIFVMFHLALWMCALTLLWVFRFPNIHRIGLPANPRLKSNSSNKSFRAFTCDRGGRLQKSGKAGLDDRPPQMDKRVRKEAPHSEVKSAFLTPHRTPPACGLWGAPKMSGRRS